MIEKEITDAFIKKFKKGYFDDSLTDRRAESSRHEEETKEEIRKFRSKLDVYEELLAQDGFRVSDRNVRAVFIDEFMRYVEELLKNSKDNTQYGVEFARSLGILNTVHEIATEENKPELDVFVSNLMSLIQDIRIFLGYKE